MASSGTVHEGPDMSYVANGVIPQYTFVKMDTTKNVVVAATAVTDHVIGITQNTSTDGGAVVVRRSGNSLLKIVTTTTAIGSVLTPSTAGAGLVTTTAGDFVGAIACEVVTTGEYAEVSIIAPAIKYSAYA